MWQIIEDAKKGRSIVLMTHSTEEAHILSDRIGILAKGRLHCIGTSTYLMSRFGTGYFAHVSFTGSMYRNTSPNDTNPNDTNPNDDAVATPYHDAVKQFFKYVCVSNRDCLHVSLTLQNLVSDFFNVFLQHLDVVPKEENKAFLYFVIPQDREARLKVDAFFIFCLVYLILITTLTF